MLLTSNVSIEWLEQNNMTKGSMIVAVPIDINDLSKGLDWKNIAKLTKDDFALLEKYYELKTK